MCRGGLVRWCGLLRLRSGGRISFWVFVGGTPPPVFGQNLVRIGVRGGLDCAIFWLHVGVGVGGAR